MSDCSSSLPGTFQHRSNLFMGHKQIVEHLCPTVPHMQCGHLSPVPPVRLMHIFRWTLAVCSNTGWTSAILYNSWYETCWLCLDMLITLRKTEHAVRPKECITEDSVQLTSRNSHIIFTFIVMLGNTSYLLEPPTSNTIYLNHSKNLHPNSFSCQDMLKCFLKLNKMSWKRH